MRPSKTAVAAFLAVPLVMCAAYAENPSDSAMSRMVEAVFEKLPSDKIDRAAGFFGPIVKKYMPVANAFRSEYEASSDKAAVIARYLPQMEAALAEAKAMPVPARYEAEKAEYVRIASSLVGSLRFLCRFRAAPRR